MTDEDIRYLEVTFEEVVEPVPAKTFRAWIYGVLADLSVDTTSWKPGAVTRLIVSAVSALAAIFSEQIAEIARGGFITLARGRWKTLCALGTYGLRRTDERFAQGKVSVVNSSAVVYPIRAMAMTITVPNGKAYRNASDFTIAANATTSGVTFVAVEAGIESNAAAGTVTNVLAPMMLGVSVTNTTAFLGSAAEDDASLEQRCLLQPKAVSPFGPREAFEYAALHAIRADGSPVGVSRVSVSRYSTGGLVTVTVGSDAGGIDGASDVPTSDLGAVHEAITLVTPPGVTSFTRTATTKLVNVQVGALWLRGRPLPVSDEAFAALAQSAVVSYFRQIRIGGILLPGSSPLSEQYGVQAVFVRDVVVRALADAKLPAPFQVLCYVGTLQPYVVFATTDIPTLGAMNASVGYCNADGTY